MRRLFWVAVGVGATVAALRKVERATGVARNLAPGNLADSIGRLAQSLREATAEFSTAMAEQEARLTETLLAERPAGAASGSVARRAARRSDDWGLDSDDPDLYL